MGTRYQCPAQSAIPSGKRVVRPDPRPPPQAREAARGRVGLAARVHGPQALGGRGKVFMMCSGRFFVISALRVGSPIRVDQALNYET